MQNFGTINETFNNIFINGIGNANNKNKKMFKKYAKTLRSSNVLRTQFHVYNNIENKVEKDAYKSLNYIKESISMLKNLGVNNIINENNYLIKFLKKNGYDLCDDYDNKILHENIWKLVKNKKTPKNLDSLLESSYYINNYINNNEKTLISENKENEVFSNDAVGTIMVDKFNKKYHDLSDNDISLFKEITLGDDKSKMNFYKKTIDECIVLINNSISKSTINEKEKLLEAKDRLLKYTYSKEQFPSEIIKINALKNDLSLNKSSN